MVVPTHVRFTSSVVTFLPLDLRRFAWKSKKPIPPNGGFMMMNTMVESVKNHQKKPSLAIRPKYQCCAPLTQSSICKACIFWKMYNPGVKTDILNLKLNTWRFGSDVFSFHSEVMADKPHGRKYKKVTRKQTQVEYI